MDRRARDSGVMSTGTPVAPVTDSVTGRPSRLWRPLIRPFLRMTPVISLDRSELGLPPGPLTMKLEQLQHTGSFKARGAFANLLLRPVPAAGVVAASGGNHGAAVAYAAGVLGIPARIFVPTVSSAAKVSRIRGYGADLVVAGATVLRCARTQRAVGCPIPAPCACTRSTRSRPCSAPAPWRSNSSGRRQEPLPYWPGIGGGGLLSGIAGSIRGPGPHRRCRA